MLVEYAELELVPELEPMLGHRCVPEGCCGLGLLGVDCVGLEGVVLPLIADHATPAPIVSAAMTTSINTTFIRTMAASFRSLLQ